MKTYLETKAGDAPTANPSPVPPEVTEEKLAEASLSGVAVYFTPEEAETLGAFEETAVEAEDVQLSRSANIEPL